MKNPIQFEDFSAAITCKNSQGDTILRLTEDELTNWIFYNEDDHVFSGSKALARELATVMLEALARNSAVMGDYVVIA